MHGARSDMWAHINKILLSVGTGACVRWLMDEEMANMFLREAIYAALK
jgi:hypothetical protein